MRLKMAITAENLLVEDTATWPFTFPGKNMDRTMMSFKTPRHSISRAQKGGEVDTLSCRLHAKDKIRNVFIKLRLLPCHWASSVHAEKKK